MLGFHKQIMSTETVMNPVPSLTVLAWICTVTYVTHVGGLMFLGARIDRTTCAVCHDCGDDLSVAITMHSARRNVLQANSGTCICITRGTCL